MCDRNDKEGITVGVGPLADSSWGIFGEMKGSRRGGNGEKVASG